MFFSGMRWKANSVLCLGYENYNKKNSFQTDQDKLRFFRMPSYAILCAFFVKPLYEAWTG